MSSRVNQPLLDADEVAALAANASLLVPNASHREVHDHHAGDWPSAWLGRGLDFEEARPYAPGDDLRDMDWRTTARLGRPFIKTYREERQPVLHLVVDRCPGMRFGTRKRLKVTQAARVALLMGFSAMERNIAVGVTLWAEADTVLSARHGRTGLLEAAVAIIAPCPPQSPAPGEAMQDLIRLQSLGTELPRGSRLLLLSDFAWLAPLHELTLAHLAERLDLLAISITDPVEHALPNVGLTRFTDMAQSQTRWIDTSNPSARAEHARGFAARHARMCEMFARCGVHHLTLSSDRDDLPTVLHGHG